VTAAGVLNRLGDEDLVDVRLLLIENVGDLICPAGHDLGETAKVALLSVPEGDDKPLKYPGLFERDDLVVITKIDMLGLTDFDLQTAARNLGAVAPGIEVLRRS
jgi:hydrogenase nickel incorporation protein HypB